MTSPEQGEKPDFPAVSVQRHPILPSQVVNVVVAPLCPHHEGGFAQGSGIALHIGFPFLFRFVMPPSQAGAHFPSPWFLSPTL
jgi:hypothetical protein